MDSASFWTVISVILGVILGFLLGEGSRWLRDRFRIRRLKNLLNKELESIQSQIPQKQAFIDLMLDALGKGQLLPGLSVSAVDTGYRRHIPELYEHLDLKRRNCLHVIYDRLRIADEVVSTFETQFWDAKRDNVVPNPFDAFSKKLTSIRDSYAVVQELITSYLAGRPIDVFNVNEQQ